MMNRAGNAGELAAAKLTALWALSEGGLGGILHATRLPLRGVVLASISAISICLISRVSLKRTAALRSAMVVLAVKAVLAPHSVGPAHLAVLDQAVLGTGCMLLFGPSLLGCVLAGALCLIETSLHPLFWPTVLMGMEFWTALDRLLVQGQVWLVGRIIVDDPARWMVVIHIAVHAVFGMAAGVIAWRLPKAAERILSSRPTVVVEGTGSGDAVGSGRGRKRPRWRRAVRALIVILAVVALAGPGLIASSHGPWYWRIAMTTVRVICVVAVIVFIVRPVLGYLMGRLAGRSRRQRQFADTLASVRALQDEVIVIWRGARGMRVWRRLPHCVAVLFALALVPERPAEQRVGAD